MTSNVAAALKSFCTSNQDASILLAILETRRQQQRLAGTKKGKKAKTTEIDEQLYALSRNAVHEFCDHAVKIIEAHLNNNTYGHELEDQVLQTLDGIAQFTTILVSENTHFSTIDPTRVFRIVQMLHDHLLQLKGSINVLQNAQDAIALLCEACWHHSYQGEVSHSVITQLLPYLIVRSYESKASDAFHSKKHPIRRLYGIRNALLLLDFEDESSGLLRDILLRCYIQPHVYRSPDAVAFLGFLFQLHVPFIPEIHATIRNQIPNQRKSVLLKMGAIYFKAWVHSEGQGRQEIEEECIQRYVQEAIHARSNALFTAIRTVLHPFFDNKRHTGVDAMLYRLSSPILWRGVTAANDSVRRQSAILLFDHFPLRDPTFNKEAMDQALQKQFDVFAQLLKDAHPAVRISAIQGIAKVLSIYWELIPSETIRCFLSTLVVDLVHDISSSGVRTAVFEALQYMLDNHHAHAVLQPLLPMLAPLIHDRQECVRAEFASLLVRIKSLRNLHFYDVVAVNDLLDRLVLDRNVPRVRKQLVKLFLNSYFPQNVGGSSQVARCLSFVKKHPEAAMIFYKHVVDQVSVGSVCKLVALLTRCSLNFVSKRRDRLAVDDEDDDEEENEEEGFSIVGRIVVLEIMSSLLGSVHVKVLNDERYSACKTFLSQQLTPDVLETLLSVYSTGKSIDDEALSSIWKVIGYMGEMSEHSLLESLVSKLMIMNETSSKKLLDSMVESLTKWHQLPFLVTKIEDVLIQWKQNEYSIHTLIKPTKKKPSFTLHPIIALSMIEYIVHSTTSPCPKHLIDRLVQTLGICVAPILSWSTDKTQQQCLVVDIQSNGFGVIRLLEVYAKVLVLAEAATVSQHTTSLLEASMTKKITTSRGKDSLQALQPSRFFTPPIDLITLLEWVVRLLVEMRKNPMIPTITGGKKRGRVSSVQDDDKVNYPLRRWRNLFSLIAMLVTECVAITLERSREYQSSEVTEFVDSIVIVLKDALISMSTLDRAIALHACQLLFLLQKKRQPSHEPIISRWITSLEGAVKTLQEKYEDQCADILAPVMSALDSIEPKVIESPTIGA